MNLPRPINRPSPRRHRRTGKTMTTANSQAARDRNLHPASVTYTVEVAGKIYVFENVPADVDARTGEQFFDPDTVERMRQLIHGDKKPAPANYAPVYDYAKIA